MLMLILLPIVTVSVLHSRLIQKLKFWKYLCPIRYILQYADKVISFPVLEIGNSDEQIGNISIRIFVSSVLILLGL